MNQQQLALDIGTARAARDAGIQRAADRSRTWADDALQDFVAFVARQGEATMEQWRASWLARGGPSPRSSKAYGALAARAAKSGLVVNTGRYVKAQSAKTHAHPVPLWRAT